MLLAILPAAATAQDAEWLIAPYAWVPDIGLSQSSGGGGGISGSDLLDKSDAAGMIRVEAAKGRWGVSVDYLWLGLSDERTDPIPANVTNSTWALWNWQGCIAQPVKPTA